MSNQLSNAVGGPLHSRMREGSAPKRAAILAAARELYVRDGVDRTSMDAVASLAGVSKRTVYDYYGDKRRLLLAVIEASGESVVTMLRRSIANHLSDAADIRDAAGLESALTAFAVEIGAELLASPEYAATVRLIAENETVLPELERHPLDIAADDLLAGRLRHFAELGLLDIEDPAVATDHFNALTSLLAYDSRHFGPVDPDRVRTVMIQGVHAFMRAYGTRWDRAADIIAR